MKNSSLLFISQPTPHSLLEENVHVKVEEREIDIDHVTLNGGVLLKTLILSSDPYMRYRFREPDVPDFCPPILIGDPVDNCGLAKVVRSDDPNLKPGDLVWGYIDFSDYSVYPGKTSHAMKVPLKKIDQHPSIPLSAYIGPMSLPGHTAYLGWKAFMEEKAKTSKTMFISTAAGAVGTFLVEYAKIVAPHLKIIGSTSTEEKVAHLKNIGVDVPINYKTENVGEVLKAHGPIDIYFDNVGGSILDATLMNMRDHGLIVACGCISSAADNSSVKNFEQIFKRSLTVRGFLCYSEAVVPYLEGFWSEIPPLIAQGKITSREHRYNGLKEACNALNSVHTGENTGKAVIVVSTD
ncbi:alcohol dehydrogenase [Irpex rosettiformis]|uniref:Alcohol dehydrogenase n=1 Tax=Irpex rosettiformis TaxID=378272 RepID=A0ACB8U498_9APHY|nr:alcohol dehydrogenase [Irpex rosettiformis]